ncbi:MAG: TerB family tellurite resistance protein, partial [Planctomycetia bacterium]
FKVASGIVSDAVVASPERFAAQWQRLVEEVISEGDRGFDHISHPFPPLRMRAMLLFSEARAAGDGAALDAANTAIDGMLAMMEPGGGGGTLDDPLLRGLFFWGGLVVALADGYVSPREWRRLETVAPPGTDLTATVASAAADDAGCWEQFSTAFLGRRRKFSGLELHRVLYGLYDVAKADGKVSDGEMERMRKLAAILGVVPEACDHIAAQFERDLRKTEPVSNGR